MNDLIERIMMLCEKDNKLSNDAEYIEYTENADDCIAAIQNELTDSKKLEMLLETLEQCNQIEKQYAFCDGIRLGFELRKIVDDF